MNPDSLNTERSGVYARLAPSPPARQRADTHRLPSPPCFRLTHATGRGTVRSLLLSILERLPPAALSRLSAASRGAYAFAHHPNLWCAHHDSRTS